MMLRRMTAISIFLAIIFTTAQAQTGAKQQGEYFSGTVAALKPGVQLSWETASTVALDLHTESCSFSIPYKEITSFNYRKENKYHLGVAPAIAVALVKQRAKLHYVTIAWRQSDGGVNVLTLEVEKPAAEGLMSVLNARVEKPSKAAGARTSGNPPLTSGRP